MEEHIQYKKIKTGLKNGKHKTTNHQGLAIFSDSILDYATDAIWSKSLDGTILTWNKAAEKLFGYKKNEIIGKNVALIIPQNKRLEADDITKKIAKNINVPYMDIERVAKNGKTIVISTTFSPVKDTSGKIIAISVISRDITKHKEIEQTLFKAEAEKNEAIAQLEAVFNSINEGMVICDTKGDYILVNKAQAKINGFKSIKEMERKHYEYQNLLTFWDMNGKNVPFKNWPLSRIMRGESIVDLELKRRRNDIGLERYYSYSGQPIKDRKGKQILSVYISKDITERKFAEDKLKSSERRFRNLADNIPNLAWISDEKGDTIWFNKRWYQYTATTPKQMEKKGWPLVVHPDYIDELYKKCKLSIKSGEPFEMIFPIKSADRTYRPFLTRMEPLRDDDGTISRWFGTNTDITEIKELERQKDDFLATASHELITPVTSLKAFGQILQRKFSKKGDEDSTAVLSKMNGQIDNLTGLIQDLLDATRIDGGKMVFNEKRFNFDELVREVGENVQLISEKHDISFKNKSKCDVFGDRDRIAQVMTNFLTNAIKYSPNSNKIIIKTACDHKNVLYCVQDTGVGIAKNKQNHIFERFFREVGDQKNTYPGLGLGLFISKEIIKRHGGKIWMESRKGKGSRFYFSLPICV